jgi:hypothetical protein
MVLVTRPKLARRPEGNLAGWPSRFVGIDDVAPVMQMAGKAIIEDAIQHGSAMEDIELRALCRFFLLADAKDAVSGSGPAESKQISRLYALKLR